MTVGNSTRVNPIHRREIAGAAIAVVPFDELGDPDWDGFAQHIERIAKVGLCPAVNMTPMQSSLLETSLQVGSVHRANLQLDSEFFAGVHVVDKPGEWFNIERYQRQIDVVTKLGAIPVVFPSHGLNALSEPEWLTAINDLGREVDKFLIAEVGPELSPISTLRPTATWLGLARTRSCVGLVHMSWSRETEFDRLTLQARMGRDFTVWSANDRAIDMPMYGSSYMLMTASMAPELFARRDRLWAEGDREVYELNDGLQFLAMATTRSPFKAQIHSLAQVMHLRGWAISDRLPEGAVVRDDHDRAVLATALSDLGVQLP